MIALLPALAAAQTVPNGDLDASTAPSEVPNAAPMAVADWDLDALGTGDPVDIALEGVPVHCADLLVASPSGGTFVHAEATHVEGAPEEERTQAIAAEIGGLVVGRPYQVRFEASIVRHYGQSSGWWRVRLGDAVVDTDVLVLPPANPGVQLWRTVTTGDLIADAETAVLELEAVSLGGGNLLSPDLPAPDCPYVSALDTAELLLDGIVLLTDDDGDGQVGDDDACPTLPLSYVDDHDGDGLLDDEESVTGTDPCDRDTDGDGVSDGDEVYRASLGDGTCPGALTPDSDGDGIVDGEEIAPPDLDIDVIACEDAGTTTTPIDEGALPTDPCDADSDRDGVPDGDEVAGGTDPARPDTDRDGLADGDDPHPLDCRNPEVSERPPPESDDGKTYAGCTCDNGSPLSALAAPLVLVALGIRRRAGATP